LRTSSKWSRIFGLSVIVLMKMLAAGTSALAQASEMGGSKGESPGAASHGQEHDLQELGKQLNNPVSSVWNITTQSNMYFYKGDLSPALGVGRTFRLGAVPIQSILQFQWMPVRR
jgi:hypothetical protein